MFWYLERGLSLAVHTVSSRDVSTDALHATLFSTPPNPCWVTPGGVKDVAGGPAQT